MAVRHVARLLPGVKLSWLCAVALPQTGLPVAQGPSHFSCMDWEIKLEGQSDKKVIWLLEEAALIQNPGCRGSLSGSEALQRWQQLLGTPFSAGSYQPLPASSAGMPSLGAIANTIEPSPQITPRFCSTL